MPISFGNVEHPPFVDRIIPDAQNSAWDDLGIRKPVGVCQHSMLGSLWGTDGYFRRSGGRSLTDYGIGGATDGAEWDGVILRWNDPRGAVTNIELGGVSKAVSRNRAPWANGGSDGLEGDGPLFVRKLGVAAINRDLVSIERSDGGIDKTPMSAKQFESICRLTASWFDQARVPWHQFPFNPATGCVTHMMHFEFATKACPFAPVRDRIDAIQARVRELLKAGQAGDDAVPEPQPTEPAPSQPDYEWWPQGYDIEQLQARFGRLMRTWPDGSTHVYQFDANGTISNAWVARGVSEKRTVAKLPRPRQWLTFEADEFNDLVVFADNWTLFRPNPDVPWKWID